MIVLDTSTWIWRASDPRRLSARARRALEQADGALVSAISVWVPGAATRIRRWR